METFLHQFGSAGSCLDPNLRVQHSRQAGFKGQSKVMVHDFLRILQYIFQKRELTKPGFLCLENIPPTHPLFIVILFSRCFKAFLLHDSNTETSGCYFLSISVCVIICLEVAGRKQSWIGIFQPTARIAGTERLDVCGWKSRKLTFPTVAGPPQVCFLLLGAFSKFLFVLSKGRLLPQVRQGLLTKPKLGI